MDLSSQVSQGLISVSELIKVLKAQGIGVGRTGSDPYNTLRYYTKIGLLPHMVRKGQEAEDKKQGATVGHYPAWVIERLKEIEELKSQGLNNKAIKAYLTPLNTSFAVGQKSELSKSNSRITTQLVLVMLAGLIAGGILLMGVSEDEMHEAAHLVFSLPREVLWADDLLAYRFIKRIDPEVARLTFPELEQQEQMEKPEDKQIQQEFYRVLGEKEEGFFADSENHHTCTIINPSREKISTASGYWFGRGDILLLNDTNEVAPIWVENSFFQFSDSDLVKLVCW